MGVTAPAGAGEGRFGRTIEPVNQLAVFSKAPRLGSAISFPVGSAGLMLWQIGFDIRFFDLAANALAFVADQALAGYSCAGGKPPALAAQRAESCSARPSALRHAAGFALACCGAMKPYECLKAG